MFLGAKTTKATSHTNGGTGAPVPPSTRSGARYLINTLEVTGQEATGSEAGRKPKRWERRTETCWGLERKGFLLVEEGCYCFWNVCCCWFVLKCWYTCNWLVCFGHVGAHMLLCVARWVASMMHDAESWGSCGVGISGFDPWWSTSEDVSPESLHSSRTCSIVICLIYLILCIRFLFARRKDRITDATYCPMSRPPSFQVQARGLSRIKKAAAVREWLSG